MSSALRAGPIHTLSQAGSSRSQASSVGQQRRRTGTSAAVRAKCVCSCEIRARVSTTSLVMLAPYGDRNLSWEDVSASEEPRSSSVHSTSSTQRDDTQQLWSLAAAAIKTQEAPSAVKTTAVSQHTHLSIHYTLQCDGVRSLRSLPPPHKHTTLQ